MAGVKKIFDQLSWSEFNETIETKMNNFYKEVLSGEKISDAELAKAESDSAYKKYKKEFPWVKFYFSCAFLILFFLVYPIILFKRLNDERKNLKQVFEEKNEIRIKAIIAAVKDINFYKAFDIGCKEIGYDPVGPIPGGFIDVLNKHVVFESDMIANSKTKNSSISSWGTFDNHSVVLNMAAKQHWMGEKQYSRSKTYTYTRYSDGKTYTCSETLTAYYTHPFPMYASHFEVGIFSSLCEGLRFSLKEEKFSVKKVFKKDDRPLLENTEFEKKFDIIRNDEAMLRIVFTADVQEYLYNQKIHNFKKEEIPSYLRYKKFGPIFSSDYLISNPLYHGDRATSNKLNEWDTSIETFLEMCNSNMLYTIRQRFLSLNVATVLPVLATEYNEYLIEELKALYKSSEICYEDTTYAQYVFLAIWEKEFFNCDTEIMNIMNVVQKTKVHNTNVVKVNIIANGYLGTELFEPVTVSGASGVHIINVPYIDYNETSDSSLFYYARIDTMDFYENGYSDFNDKTVELIDALELTNRVIIKNKHIALLSSDASEYEKVIKLTDYIQKNVK
ncbi:MAG: hypothetical protein ACRC42_02905 [Mycoplasma sp.]